MSCGSRRRLDTVWLNDWNPATNSGGPYDCSAYSDFTCGKDSHQPRTTPSGDSALRASLEAGLSKKAKMINEEGFTNVSEGNGIYRSLMPKEWAFPNQHIGVMRQY